MGRVTSVIKLHGCLVVVFFPLMFAFKISPAITDNCAKSGTLVLKLNCVITTDMICTKVKLQLGQ